MKRLFFTLILLAAALFGSAQTVPVQAKIFRIGYGGQTFSINMNIDSVLMNCKEPVWFNSKFGSDTLLFGDKTYMTTAFIPGLTDTGYVKTTGDTITGSYRISGDYSYFEFYKDTTNFITIDCNGIILNAGASGLQITPGLLKLDQSILNINDVLTIASDTSMTDDASKVFTTAAGGWGEVYVFTSTGIIDEWAEFIFSSDGTVYLKSNSTDVANTDTDDKLCIFDNGTSITIRNRLGGARTIKYIIHH